MADLRLHVSEEFPWHPSRPSRHLLPSPHVVSAHAVTFRCEGNTTEAVMFMQGYCTKNDLFLRHGRRVEPGPVGSGVVIFLELHCLAVAVLCRSDAQQNHHNGCYLDAPSGNC